MEFLKGKQFVVIYVLCVTYILHLIRVSIGEEFLTNRGENKIFENV